MKTKWGAWVAAWVVVGAAIAALPALAASATAQTAAAAPAERIGVEFTVTKVGSEAGVFRCATTVKDLTAQRVLAAPDIQFRLGIPATTTSQDPESGLAVEISVSVTGGGEQIDHVVVVRRGETVVASQSATVHLPM